MKILISGYHNPHYFTITEYIENAIKELGHTCISFDDRQFLLPGRLRDKFKYIHKCDLGHLNRKLIDIAKKFNPELFVCVGGDRIIARTVREIKATGIKTVYWTIDPLFPLLSSRRGISNYDFIFCGGTEAIGFLRKYKVNNLFWLPFACDPRLHRPVDLNKREKTFYGSDVAFVGSLEPIIYSERIKILEAISDFRLSVWGPSSEVIPKDSPLRPLVNGGKTPFQVWRKIYSAAKIVICTHYKDPKGQICCHQASPRVYEALACGAFLVVDAQKDVLTLFKDKEELVIFKDIKDLREILKYYLANPEEREVIAKRGREAVLENHSYLHRIQAMLDVVNKVK